MTLMTLRRRRQLGFTLIEMMVVVAIVAVLAGMLISASSRPVGASARNSAEELVSMINFAKLRAQSTRKVHRVHVTPQAFEVDAASLVGLSFPAGATWERVQNKNLASSVHVNDVVNGAIVTTGASYAANGSLAYDIVVRPDGQATASTAYITDGVHQWRVLTYHVTGTAYARETW